jgi:hypothetical protein
LPARLIINGGDSDVVVNSITAPKRSASTLTVADADLAAWINTAGICVMDGTPTHNLRRAVAKRIGHA